MSDKAATVKKVTAAAAEGECDENVYKSWMNLICLSVVFVIFKGAVFVVFMYF